MMTDEEILAYYRRANPYISLAEAKELHRIEWKFGCWAASRCGRSG